MKGEQDNTLTPIGGRVKVKQAQYSLGPFLVRVDDRSIPGQDDRVYENEAGVWESVPRGQANIYIAMKPDDEEQQHVSDWTHVCSLRGLRKFGYSDSTYGKRDQVSSVVAMDKENGECVHVSAFEFDGVKFWALGSKQTHMVLRDANLAHDLKSPEFVNERYRAARKIASLFVETMLRQSPDNRRQFLDALATNQWTANGESIFADSQHIVDYNGINEFRWFAISFDQASTVGLCLSPDESKSVFESCGLHAITRSEKVAYKSAEYDSLVERIGQRCNAEGCVMYGCDVAGKVVCMWKEKSYPYVMERIAREAIKRGLVGAELAAYIQRRLAQQKRELRKFFHEWEEMRLPFLLDFAAFIAEKFPVGAKKRDPWAISCQWLSLQREFSSLPQGRRQALVEKHCAQTLTGPSAISSIVLVGPPGSGKSTLARSLMNLLHQSGKTPVWLNQDETGSRQAFLDAIKRTISSPETSHVILDKSNMEQGNRDDYTVLGLVPILTVVFVHPEGTEAMRNTCVSRIMGRGDAHRSLCPSSFVEQKKDPKREIQRIIGSFLDRGDIEEYMDETCVLVDTTLSPHAVASTVWDALVTVDPSMPKQNELGDALGKSVQLSAQYEAVLKQLSSTKQLYAAVRVEKDEMAKVLQHVPQAALAGKKLRDEFHMTVKYFGGVVDPKWFVEHSDQLGKTVQLRITEIAFDERGIAAVVETPNPCANKIPHITIACSQGTAPVYSNTLVAKPNVKRIAMDVNIAGVNVFM